MRRALVWLVPAATAAAVAPLARGDDGDGRAFAAAGRLLLSPHWSHAFADPRLQVGPLQLALYGSVGRSETALAVSLGACAAVLVVTAARAAGVRRPSLLVAAGLAAVATGLTRGAYEAGHPADALLPLLWVLAAADARRGRSLRAGLLVGVGAGFETWGVLGVAVLACAPRAVGIAAGVAGLLFAPFLAAGHFAAGEFEWSVTAHSLLGHVVAPGTAFGWPLRIAQGAAAIAAGAALARLLRRDAAVVWVVPLAVVAVRLALDPLDSDYYFLALASPALVGLALLASRASRFSFTTGQSSSSTAYHAESRRSPPRTSMCFRNTPSNVAGSAASAARERSFAASVLNSTRR
jgi:hypothetical protein